MITVTTVYRTSNGKIFESLDLAQAEERIIQFTEWYENHVVYGNYEGSKVDCAEVIAWLTEYRDKILEFLEPDTNRKLD